jgi:signal transduction histidine kinase
MERQIQRLMLRERGRFEVCLAQARRRLAHTLEVEEMGQVVMGALERSRSVTTAGLYLLVDDGSVFEQLAALGDHGPVRIDVAAASPLLDELRLGPVVLEQIRRDVQEGRSRAGRHVAAEALLAAAEVLGPLRHRGVVLGIFAEEGELVGLLALSDERIDDAFSPEDIALLEQLAAQIGVVVVNSRVYAKMKERDRLAVLGQMAAGLAHEIRNPLGAIKGSAQLLAEPAEGVELDDSSREFLGIILEEVDRLDRVVGSVLDLARQSTDVVAPIDVNAVVRRTLQVLSAGWSDAEILVDASLDEDLPRAAIAPEQLRQVLMNLLRNAAQALRGRGRITVRSRSRQRAGDKLVVVSVSDDGPGIDQAALKKVFLPFFTTKEGGTGLGLAICQRIVQGVGGRLEVRSRRGEGTTFDVILPAVMGPLRTPTPSPAAAQADQGGEAKVEPPAAAAGPARALDRSA